MHLVIADTGPINYLVQIGQVEILPRMFERVVLPGAVQTELSDPVVPPPVQRWITNPPVWLEIVKTQTLDIIAGVHDGEAASIALAASLHADLLLMDERKGVSVAKQRALRVTGTLGVLDLAAERGLVVFGQAIKQLERTTFESPKR